MGKVVHGEQHGAALFLDRMEGLVVVNVNLGVKEIVGDGGYGRGCVRGSSGYLRHVWGGRNEGSFPKDETNKTCFYKQEMKRKEKKIKNENSYSTISSFSLDVRIR
jgi:hypothetical protein